MLQTWGASVTTTDQSGSEQTCHCLLWQVSDDRGKLAFPVCCELAAGVERVAALDLWS